jgi:hypothetical protein
MVQSHSPWLSSTFEVMPNVLFSKQGCRFPLKPIVLEGENRNE